jgi:hypothetical protein
MWIGAAFEVGGEIVVGLNTTVGCLFRKGAPGHLEYIKFMTEHTSLGIGLGGSASLSLLLGFNIQTEWDVDGADSGFDYSLDLAVSGASKYLRSIPDYLQFMYQFQKGLGKGLYIAGKALELVEKYDKVAMVADNVIRNAKGAFDAAGGKPAIISIPVGTGLRFSVNYKVSVTDVQGSGIIQYI